MKEYTINFFFWWYYYQNIRMFQLAKFEIIFLLTWTRTLPMLKNIFKPLFGQTSHSSRFIGFFIRFWWVLIGGAFCLVFMIPIIAGYLFYLALPFLPLIQIFRFILL